MEQRIKILNTIFQNFSQITTWLPNNIETAAEYMYKAEAFIERLEADDCGQIGGYDQKSPVVRKSGFLLYDRYIALVNRYDNRDDIKKCCHFDLDNLGEYFKKLSELRRSFLTD